MMMIKLILLLLSQTKPRNSKVSRGFTLVEVIVAMLILSVFIVTALTALVTGLNTKLKSKLANEATLIMQQDLEKIRYQAAIYGSPTVSDTPTVVSATTPSALKLNVPVRFTKAIVDNAPLKVGLETTAYTRTPPSSTDTLNNMPVTVDLTKISTASSTTLTQALTTGAQTSIQVADTSKIKAGDLIVIGPNGTIPLSTTVVKDYGNNPTTGAGAVNVNTFTVPSGGYAATTTPVRVLPRSGDIIDTVANMDTSKYVTATGSFAAGDYKGLYPYLCQKNTIASSFQTALGLVSLGSTGTTYQAVPPFNGRPTYTLKRAVAPSQDNATNLSNTRLQIVYNVRDTAASPNQDLSTLTAEVIPSVAYQCP